MEEELKKLQERLLKNKDRFKSNSPELLNQELKDIYERHLIKQNQEKMGRWADHFSCVY